MILRNLKFCVAAIASIALCASLAAYADDCGKCVTDPKNADTIFCKASSNSCPKKVWTEESRSQRCDGGLLEAQCRAAPSTTVHDYTDYDAAQYTSSSAGYVCNDAGSLFFGVQLEEPYVVGSIANDKKCTAVEANTCVCYSKDKPNGTGNHQGAHPRCNSCMQ
jgi:hypothetical protein